MIINMMNIDHIVRYQHNCIFLLRANMLSLIITIFLLQNKVLCLPFNT